MKQFSLVALIAAALCLTASACKSTHEEGVKSNIMSQWTSVSADTQATTDAAKAVLTDEGLKDVTAKATNVDGKAMGKMADGTKVSVNITRDPKATMSQVSVSVGTMGNPALGADIAKKIKMRAEGM